MAMAKVKMSPDLLIELFQPGEKHLDCILGLPEDAKFVRFDVDYSSGPDHPLVDMIIESADFSDSDPGLENIITPRFQAMEVT